VADFVEICNVCARKGITEAAKRIINSDKVCHSYSNLNFGVTFLEHSVVYLSYVIVYIGDAYVMFHCILHFWLLKLPVSVPFY